MARSHVTANTTAKRSRSAKAASPTKATGGPTPPPLRDDPFFQSIVAADRERLAQRRADPAFGVPRPLPEPLQPRERTVQLSVRLPESLRADVRAGAEADEVTVQEFVIRAIRERLRRVEELEVQSANLQAFADEMWEQVRSGAYHRLVEELVEPDLWAMREEESS